MREAKAKASHFFSAKNIGIFEKLTFENLTKTLTNDVVSFEQPGPDSKKGALHMSYAKLLIYDLIDKISKSWARLFKTNDVVS